MSATYSITMGGNNITDAVTRVDYNSGRSERFGEHDIGTCELELTDPNGVYYAFGTINAQVNISALLSGTVWGIWVGYVDEIIPRLETSTKGITIRCVDALEKLNRAIVSVPVKQGLSPYQLVGSVVIASGWGTANYDAYDHDIIPYWWCYKENALDAIRNLSSDVMGAFYSYVDPMDWENDRVFFESRARRLVDPYNTVVGPISGTITSANNEIQWAKLTKASRNIFNVVETSYTPRFPSAEGTQVVWESGDDQTIRVEGSATSYPWGTASAQAWQEIEVNSPIVSWGPIAGTANFWAATSEDGSGTDMTPYVSITIEEDRGMGALLKFANSSGTPCYVTWMAVEGLPLESKEAEIYETKGTASMTSYGRLSKKLGGEWMPNMWTAKNIADYYLGESEQPKSLLTLGVIGSKTDTLLAKCLALRLSHYVQVYYNPGTAIINNLKYHIDGIKGEISQGMKLHTFEFTLAPEPKQVYWLLGSSELGTNTRLGW